MPRPRAKRLADLAGQRGQAAHPARDPRPEVDEVEMRE